MVEPASFEELDQSIRQVLEVETNNFFDLAQLLGLNPKQDFAGADLSGTDFFEGDLAGGNFTEANLRGANFAYANLKGVRLTNTDLGILPSSYLFRTNELTNKIDRSDYDYPDRTSTFTLEPLAFREITSNHGRNLARNLDSAIKVALNFASALDSEAESDLGRNFARDLAFYLARARDSARDLTSDLDSAGTLARNLASANIIASDLDSVSAYNLVKARACIHNLICSINGGTNFYKANLTGAMLDGANVEGAIMIGCMGLSDSEVADLRRRGAIVDNSLSNRTELTEFI